MLAKYRVVVGVPDIDKSDPAFALYQRVANELKARSGNRGQAGFYILEALLAYESQRATLSQVAGIGPTPAFGAPGQVVASAQPPQVAAPLGSVGAEPAAEAEKAPVQKAVPVEAGEAKEATGAGGVDLTSLIPQGGLKTVQESAAPVAKSRGDTDFPEPKNMFSDKDVYERPDFSSFSRGG